MRERKKSKEYLIYLMCFLVFALLLGDGFSDFKKKKAKSHRERSWATASLTKKKMKKIYIYFSHVKKKILG
jgi:hypothetical protein